MTLVIWKNRKLYSDLTTLFCTHQYISLQWDKPGSSTPPLVACLQSWWSSWTRCPLAQNLKYAYNMFKNEWKHPRVLDRTLEKWGTSMSLYCGIYKTVGHSYGLEYVFFRRLFYLVEVHFATGDLSVGPTLWSCNEVLHLQLYKDSQQRINASSMNNESTLQPERAFHQGWVQ